MRRFTFAFVAVLAVIGLEASTRSRHVSGQESTSDDSVKPLVLQAEILNTDHGPSLEVAPGSGEHLRIEALPGDFVFAPSMDTPIASPECHVHTESLGLSQASVDADSLPVPDEYLRREFLRLMSAQADLMTADELTTAIKSATVTTGELQAKKKLDEAKALLREIVEEFPNTEAANAASKANASLRPSAIQSAAEQEIEAIDMAMDPFGDFDLKGDDMAP